MELHTSERISTKIVEIAGRNWFTSQLLLRGFEVATPEVDRGIDLIVFREIGEQGIRALPLQLKCSSGEAFGLDRKYANRGIPLIYIWNVLKQQPEFYIMTYEDGLAVLGEQAQRSASWSKGGSYSKNYVSRELRERLAPFRNQWDWLDARLGAQPSSA